MFYRILVPVDGSETSLKALAMSLQMAGESQGRVRIVHVIEGMAYSGGTVQTESFPGGLMGSVREAGKKLLEDAQALATAAGVEVETELFDTFDGRLADVVSEAATQWQADLIVVGTHGRRGIGRVLMGSGAEQILRLASTPVLVVRAQTPAR